MTAGFARAHCAQEYWTLETLPELAHHQLNPSARARTTASFVQQLRGDLRRSHPAVGDGQY